MFPGESPTVGDLECMLSGLAIVAGAFVLVRLPRMIAQAWEWRAATSAPPGEVEALEIFARAHAGTVELASRLPGMPPTLDGAQLCAKVNGRRAWAEVKGHGPFSVSAEVEIDGGLDLVIRRPAFYRRAKNSARVSASPDLSQPDMRFDVQRAKDARGAIADELFSHVGEALTDPLAELLYVHGADEVRGAAGRLGVTVEIRSLVAVGLARTLLSLEAVASAYSRRPAPVEIGGLVERYLWLEGNAPRCPYCHVDIAEGEAALVACGRCKTVHHEACFQEHGGCTLLGCGGVERAA
ncbi:hypothetical protein HY251_19575 [bacterium]|nr:hypothetical protein [bacterium]